jgi:hypothetical protein
MLGYAGTYYFLINYDAKTQHMAIHGQINTTFLYGIQAGK